jgi:UDP-N-acetylmuramoyl-tripeptide--D-alanyl-D-alanine ligase
VIFTGGQVAAATGGRLVADAGPGPITTDSRRVAPGSWFLALRGDRFDAHDFLPMAAAAGCAGAVVSAPPPGWDRGLVVVPDTLVALQDLARSVRRQFRGPVVGLTGSAGKTSTRVMIVSCLQALGRVHATGGNLNNHVGLPLTLLATPPDADALVVELGMNHPGEIAALADIAQPAVRLITNVGAAHVEGCGSVEGVARAKQELFDGARPGDTLVVNLDDPFVSAMPHPPGVRVITFGTRAGADVQLTDAAVDPARLQTRLRIECADGVVRATLEVPGLHLCANACAAVAVARALHVPVEGLGDALSSFQPEGMRNRVVRLRGAAILDDAYNANPVSMSAALRTLAAMGGRRIAVLGDMLELGAEEEPAHAAVLAEARALGVDRVMVCGERMARAAGAIAEVYSEPDALADALVLAEGDSVLIKGSRGARMERVLDRLRERSA